MAESDWTGNKREDFQGKNGINERTKRKIWKDEDRQRYESEDWQRKMDNGWRRGAAIGSGGLTSDQEDDSNLKEKLKKGAEIAQALRWIDEAYDESAAWQKKYGNPEQYDNDQEAMFLWSVDKLKKNGFTDTELREIMGDLKSPPAKRAVEKIGGYYNGASQGKEQIFRKWLQSYNPDDESAEAVPDDEAAEGEPPAHTNAKYYAEESEKAPADSYYGTEPPPRSGLSAVDLSGKKVDPYNRYKQNRKDA